jgi:hypothetical protein
MKDLADSLTLRLRELLAHRCFALVLRQVRKPRDLFRRHHLLPPCASLPLHLHFPPLFPSHLVSFLGILPFTSHPSPLTPHPPLWASHKGAGRAGRGGRMPETSSVLASYSSSCLLCLASPTTPAVAKHGSCKEWHSTIARVLLLSPRAPALPHCSCVARGVCTRGGEGGREEDRQRGAPRCGRGWRFSWLLTWLFRRHAAAATPHFPFPAPRF